MKSFLIFKNNLSMCKHLFILFAFIGIACNVSAQQSNWQNQDLEKDSVFGISLEKTYQSLLKNKKSQPVIVAVIDTGIDTAHEDLRPVLWTDPLDGAHGHSYMGWESGREDITQLAGAKKDFYDSLSFTRVPETLQADYHTSRVLVEDYQAHIGNLESLLQRLKESKRVLEEIMKAIGKSEPTPDDFKNYKPANDAQKAVLKLIESKLPEYKHFREFYFSEIDHLIALGEYHLSHGLNMNLSGREKDSTKNDAGDVMSDPLGLIEEPNISPYHGTHVSGVIAAAWNNGKGMNGIADNVQVMALKVLTNIREMRDRDLAAAIRFACDHGARVINMSLGKIYTIDKAAVDNAVRYAMAKDVLIVHGGGNSGIDLDAPGRYFYPIRQYKSGGKADAWINVGASGPKDDSTLIASFSNYGKKTIDVFAPGVGINSTIPHSKYVSWSGTSMAAPVVSGLAALIMEYHPKLTAAEVKDIIMKSVVKRDALKDKCVSGGVVNAYNALKLAASYK
jgi:subtilisin family serine protease